MIKRVIVLAVLFILLTVTPACAEWSDANKKLFGLYTVLMVVDLGQTLNLENNGREEANPFLGAHPSKEAIYSYFMMSYLLSLGAVDMLSQPWDGVFLGVVIGMEMQGVNNNYNAGISIRF